MRRIRPILLLLLLLFGLIASARPSLAQMPGVTIGFQNDTKMGIVVQGSSTVNNVPRRGQPFQIAPGRKGFDTNVPAGVRLIIIYDASQPSRVLLQTPIPVQNQNLSFSVRPGPNGLLMLVPKK